MSHSLCTWETKSTNCTLTNESQVYNLFLRHPLVNYRTNVSSKLHLLCHFQVGPCGVEFREAFSCFHYSTSEVKGSECVEKFAEMQLCMQKYPELFEEREAATKDATEGSVDLSGGNAGDSSKEGEKDKDDKS